MGSRDLINKFTSGELDPKFLAEVDYDGYRKAARKLRNVICVPQGGAQRRFGSHFEHIIENQDGPITNIDEVRLISYEHLNDELYYIVIRSDTVSDVAFDVYLEDAFQMTVPAAAATYTVPMIREIRWVKDYDRLILLHTAVRPYELRRTGVATWELLPITFQFFPTYDFSSSDDPATLPTPNTPYTSPGVTFTPNAVAATTVTSNTVVYTSNHVGGLYYGNGGIFRITAVNAGGTVATGYTLEEFVDTSAIPGDLSALLERAWNDGQAIAGAPAGVNRGWPSHGTFYQSRLVLGGSPALPGFAYASNTRKYYDFDDSSSDPSYSWGVEIGVTGNDVIREILATKSLVLISNKGPASTSILIDTPTTPTNAFMNTQGTEGARNMDAVIIDNQIMYADRAGNTIWSMAYEIPDTGYNIANASILSTQLIRNPRWADIYDPDDVDGRYYMLVNSDGSLAIYNSISVENIKAWTLAQTLGSYCDIACVANEAKTLTRRKVSLPGSGSAPDGAYTVDSTFNVFRNIRAAIITGAGTPIMVQDKDYILIGSEIEFEQFFISFITPADQNLNLTYEFLTNTGEWETFVPTFDTTNGFTGLVGAIQWAHDDVTNWKSQVLPHTTLSYGELVPYYWIRIKRNNVAATNPVVQFMFVNTEDRILMERLDFNIYMDSQVETTSNAAGLITGLDHLAGQNVFIFATDFPIGTFYVDAAGTTTIPVFNADVSVGLDYTPLIVPMPVTALLQNGWSVYEPVHIENMYVDYYLSLGIIVQTQNIPQISPGDFLTEEAPIPVSGYYKIPTFGGWDSRFEFVISQSYPAPMTILGISYTMEVSP
jgi:hypothetical protein